MSKVEKTSDSADGSGRAATPTQTAAGKYAALPSSTDEIIRSLRMPSHQYAERWYDPAAKYATKPSALLEDAADKIEGLEADLYLAVQTAYRRGAVEWARLNYPKWAERLSADGPLGGHEPDAGPSLIPNDLNPNPDSSNQKPECR